MRETRRQLQKTKETRADRVLLMMIIMGPIALYFAYELARSLYHMHEAQRFISELEHRSTEQIKADLNHYVILLSDRNAFVRDGAIASFKAATGWNPGSDGGEWKRMWKEREPTWEFHPYKPLPPQPAMASWASQLPSAIQQSNGIPVTVEPQPTAP